MWVVGVEPDEDLARVGVVALDELGGRVVWVVVVEVDPVFATPREEDPPPHADKPSANTVTAAMRKGVPLGRTSVL